MSDYKCSENKENQSFVSSSYVALLYTSSDLPLEGFVIVDGIKVFEETEKQIIRQINKRTPLQLLLLMIELPQQVMRGQYSVILKLTVLPVSLERLKNFLKILTTIELYIIIYLLKHFNYKDEVHYV